MINKQPVNIGHKIRKIRELKNLKQETVGNAIGINQKRILILSQTFHILQ